MRTAAELGALAIMAGLIAQQPNCSAAVWEGTDDFSGTLAKWDTTYIHSDNPSDGFFLSGGQLQFIKTTTTTDYSGSGAVIWPQSLPFNTNWTLMVDTHMNPGTYEAPQIADQDVELAVRLYSTAAPGMTYFRIGVVTSPYANTYGNFISIDGVDPTNIIGTNITLGMSYDSVSKQVTSFYFPAGNPGSLVIIQTNDVSAWPEMRPVLHGASDYWAISANKVWMDNFRVNGTAVLRPSIAITKITVSAQSSLTNGLVAYYPFNGNANDASGNGHNGSAQHTFVTTNQFGQANSALAFSGNGWVSVPYASSLSTTDFTVSLMFNAKAGFNTFCLLRSGGVSADLYRGYELTSVNNHTDFGFWVFDGSDSYGTGSCLTPIGNWQQNTWYNLTFTQSGTNSRLYLNGVVIGANTNSTPYAPAQNNDIYIGANIDSAFFTGIICDVRFYNRGLSATEVQQLYGHEINSTSGSSTAVELSFSNLILGRKYQLQVSGNLVNWTNQDSAFTATGSAMSYPQYSDTDKGENLFFRLQLVP